MCSTPSFEALSCDQVRWHPRGSQFATASGPVIATHTPNREELWRLTLDVPVDDGWELARLCYSPTGRWLAIDAGNNGVPWREGQPTLTVVDTATGAVAVQLPNSQGSIDCLSWHPDDDLLAVSTLKGQVLLVDLADGDVRTLLETAGLPHAISWHPDGTRLAVAEFDQVDGEDHNSLHLIDATGGVLWQATGFDSAIYLFYLEQRRNTPGQRTRRHLRPAVGSRNGRPEAHLELAGAWFRQASILGAMAGVEPRLVTPAGGYQRQLRHAVGHRHRRTVA